MPGGIAQLVEHLLCTQGASGSSPLTSTSFKGLLLSDVTCLRDTEP